MLKSWSIKNFKPIVNSGELVFAPVTVLAGLNSSGKSSLLQSILMISQTLSSRLLDRPLLPNGPIIQLGTFGDILNEQSKSRTLTVGFDLDMELEESPPKPGQRAVINIWDVISTKVTAEFDSANSHILSTSAIEASNVIVKRIFLEFNCTNKSAGGTGEKESMKFRLNIQRFTGDELKEFLNNVDIGKQRSSLFTDSQSIYLGNFITNKQETGTSYLVVLSHFLPNRFFQKYNREQRLRQTLIGAIPYLFEPMVKAGQNTELADRVSELVDHEAQSWGEFLESMQKICSNEKVSKKFDGQSISELVHWFMSLKNSASKKDEISQRVQEALQQAITKNPLKLSNSDFAEGLEAVVDTAHADILEQAVGQITRFYTSKIRYLGPLRADPQASQKFAPSSELDDVGAKGEFAAAVYDANHNASIEWYNPFTQKVERGVLKVALDSWVRYLDVANQIKTADAGQSGFSWQVVHKKGHKPLPLTAVGVGVSQILPILVMGLLSPANTFLIVEQPELHLHPRVQARLGDFFIGLSKCKKQCLLETHSENLISQLRYHIVQSGGQEESNCKIYFVDQDDQGIAKFEPIKISPQGNILNWPEGFFDETMHQEDEITAASIRRRAKLAKNG